MSRRIPSIALACSLCWTFGQPLRAEDITLTTYYPAPRGVYEEIRTTNNTYLASLAGSVGIGTATVPGGGKFAVAGIGQNPVGGVCPTGTNWYDDNGNGTPDNGECKPTGLYVAAAGNVGIGTTNPVAKLQIKGDVALESMAGGLALPLPAGGTLIWNDATWLRLNQNRDFSKPIFGVHTPGVFAPGSLNVGGAGGWGDPGSGNVWITGNVGIGTTAPAQKLDVNGDIAVSGVDALRRDGANAYLFPWSTGYGNNLVIVGGGTNTNLQVTGSAYLATNTGDVAIGTTTTGARLHVAGSTKLDGNVVLLSPSISVTKRTVFGPDDTVQIDLGAYRDLDIDGPNMRFFTVGGGSFGVTDLDYLDTVGFAGDTTLYLCALTGTGSVCNTVKRQTCCTNAACTTTVRCLTLP